ncbi:MAG: hypothetical protein KC615_06335 [Anaerolineae bacterium]|nr:hypothetical protein [Anaerolineae bacterium]MCA9892582.1 hypothetical protein [Anaerolineae bacterium]
MQITCPNCGQMITSEHINIQKMAAVCPTCHHVFPFELQTAKTKRRKVKQPEGLMLRDEDHALTMSFRTNWRLERNENFVGTMIGGGMMSLVTVLLTNEYLKSGDVPFILPIFLGVFAMVMLYGAAVIAYNKTHITMTDYEATISRGPLPGFTRSRKVDLAGVVSIGYEETAVSKKEAYDTPRYRVWAEMADGSRRTIINDLVEDYAAFVAQRMQERLDYDLDPIANENEAPNIGRLIEAEEEDIQASELNGSRSQSHRSPMP